MINYIYVFLLVFCASQSKMFAQQSKVAIAEVEFSNGDQASLKIASLASQLDIYPNPASHRIVVTNTSKADVEITIFNIVGDPMVVRQSVIENVEINISNLSDGVYIVAINNGNEVVTQRLVKRS